VKATGNIRKMRVTNGSPIQYTLPLYQILAPNEEIAMNPFVGKDISISFTGNIHCVTTGKKINKTFGEGLSYDAWQNSPMAAESIIRPELCQAHLGIGLRDAEWEIERHVRPHYVYLAQTSNVKVGVTRDASIPSRWIDQGAWKALPFAKTPYRQKAGIIEVALKEHISDKTHWQNMLKDVKDVNTDLLAVKEEMKAKLPKSLRQYVLDDEEIVTLEYPVIEYPSKVKSLKLDKVPTLEKKLIGIRGQYLLFSDNTVINMRSHAGYEITIEA